MKSLTRTKQKVVSLFVAMMMFVSLFTAFPVKAAEGVATGLTASKTDVLDGETFNLNVKVDQNTSILGLLYHIHYDSSKVEVVSIKDYPTAEYSILSNDVKNASKVSIALDAVSGIKIKNGNIADITFRALDNVKGEAAFTLEIENLLDPNFGEYTPLITNATVNIKLPPTDISSLTAKLTEAKGYSESAYTATSFAALKTAIGEAEKITTENTKEEVAAQVTALQKAIDGLKKAVNKEALKTAINAVPADLTVYTPETAYAVASARTAAQALLDNADLEDTAENQAAVKKAVDQLNEAVKALQALPQKDILAKRIAEAEAKLNDGNTYMSADVKAVEAALVEARRVNEDENAVESEVSKALADLDKAVSALRIKADKAVYDEAVAQIKNSFVKEDYTTGSWENYQSALDGATALSAKMETEEVPQVTADSLLDALQTASKGLVPVANAEEKAAFEKAMADCEAVNAEFFTKDSYAKVTDALEAARALNLKDSSADAVKAATETLNNAIKTLVTVVKDQNSGIVVEGLEAGSKIEVTDKTEDKETTAAVDEAIKKADVFATAEKTELLFVGEIKPEVLPNGTTIVKIPVAKAQQGYQAYFVGYRNADGSYSWKKADLKDGVAVFGADAYGEFALVGANFPVPQEPAVPGTGTTVSGQENGKGNVATGLQNESAGLMIAGLLIVAAAGFAGYRKKIMR